MIRLANDHKETKQHATKKSVGQRGNQKMPWDKQQWKHNFQKSVGCSVSGSKRKVCSDIGLTQKKKKRKEKSQNNLIYHLKELEKEEQSQKPAEGKK